MRSKGVSMENTELFTRLKELGIEVKTPLLYELAFTHSSVNGMEGTKHHDYERLEFLGDSLIGLVVSVLCFTMHPTMQQGSLSAMKANFIKTESEARYARKLGFSNLVKVGASFQGKPENNNKVMEDVFESFVGALFLDQGLDFAYQFLYNLLKDDVQSSEVAADLNPKSELQEALQAEYRESVTYQTISETGPAHNKHFVIAAYFVHTELGRGEGKSKKEAETNAAKDALRKLAKK